MFVMYYRVFGRFFLSKTVPTHEKVVAYLDSLFPCRISLDRLRVSLTGEASLFCAIRVDSMKIVREEPTVSVRKRSRTDFPEAAPPSKPLSGLVTPRVAQPSEGAGTHWTFLTNHSHVLVLLSRNPSLVLREVALQVGLTERAVQRIIADLESGGIIEREKVGRQNHYVIRTDQPLRHVVSSRRTVGELLDLINGADR
jgi:predicted DNA-binding transcriptional regulator